MKHFMHDPSHSVVQAGKLGRLQCVLKELVLPGDTWECDLSAFARFNAFEHHLLANIEWDFWAFFAPWRDAYEIGWARGTWQNFIRQDNIVTSEAKLKTLPGLVTYTGGHTRPCYLEGSKPIGFDIPWTHNRIWDFYFRDPLSATARTAVAQAHNSWNEANDRLYGPSIGRLKNVLTTIRSVPLGDTSNQKTVQVQNGAVDLLELGKQAQQWMRVAHQNITNIRAYFRQAHRATFGVAPKDFNPGVPQFLGHKRIRATVQDVVATSAGDGLGTYVGHSAGKLGFHLPRMSFPEHGWLWVFVAARLDPHYQNTRRPTSFLRTYDQISGDPDTYGQGEIGIPRNWYDGNTDSSSVLGYLPNLEYMRRNPNYVHPKFTKDRDNSLVDQGSLPSSWERLWREPDDDSYDSFFQSSDEGHYSIQCDWALRKLSIIPPADTDLYQAAMIRPGRSLR